MRTISDRVARICAPLPGAYWTDESTGEHPCWKLEEKMFAMIGHRADGVSVKCRDAETASMLIDAGVAIKAPYFHKSWVRLEPSVAEDELRHRIEGSYTIIRSSLPKKVQAALAPWPIEGRA